MWNFWDFWNFIFSASLAKTEPQSSRREMESKLWTPCLLLLKDHLYRQTHESGMDFCWGRKSVLPKSSTQNADVLQSFQTFMSPGAEVGQKMTNVTMKKLMWTWSRSISKWKCSFTTFTSWFEFLDWRSFDAQRTELCDFKNVSNTSSVTVA